MLFAGLRIGETVALDVEDVTISARKGHRDDPLGQG